MYDLEYDVDNKNTHIAKTRQRIGREMDIPIQSISVIMGGLKIKLYLIVKGEKHDYAIIL